MIGKLVKVWETKGSRNIANRLSFLFRYPKPFRYAHAREASRYYVISFGWPANKPYLYASDKEGYKIWDTVSLLLNPSIQSMMWGLEKEYAFRTWVGLVQSHLESTPSERNK